MKKNRIQYLVGFLVLVLSASFFLSWTSIDNHEPDWGFFGHRRINRMAVFTLPPEMVVFYKKHIDYVTDHAIDPDKRRYASPHEAVRHYMDLDHYGKPPFKNLPRNWTDALLQYTTVKLVTKNLDTLPLLVNVEPEELLQKFSYQLNTKLYTKKDSILIGAQDYRQLFYNNIVRNYYDEFWSIPCDSLARMLGVSVDDLNCQNIIGEDHLSSEGILPYHLLQMQHRLRRAFEEGDSKKILRLSADFGHYIADAHVPLHTTKNYNGQLSGQNGIHAFWESRLPELFADESYDFWVGKSSLIIYEQDYFWEMVLESHKYVDSVLNIEMDLRSLFPEDRQICFEDRNGNSVKTQCREFAEAYHNRMGGMVEKRMRDAILAVGSAWYTAWWNAGSPDLRYLDGTIKPEEEDLEVKVKEGKILGRKHDD